MEDRLVEGKERGKAEVPAVNSERMAVCHGGGENGGREVPGCSGLFQGYIGGQGEGCARNLVYREVESSTQACTVFLDAWLLRTGLLVTTCGNGLLQMKKLRL